MRLLKDTPSKTVHLENLLIELGTCESCVAKNKSYWMKRNQIRRLELITLEEARCELEELETDRSLVETGMMCLRDCHLEELQELIEQEANVVVHYMNIDARNAKMSMRKKHMAEQFLSHFKRT